MNIKILGFRFEFQSPDSSIGNTMGVALGLTSERENELVSIFDKICFDCCYDENSCLATMASSFMEHVKTDKEVLFAMFCLGNTCSIYDEIPRQEDRNQFESENENDNEFPEINWN